jgi:hypothetical protein
MEKKKFMFYNVLSSFMVIYINIRRTLFIWVLLENYQILKEHIELIVIGLVVVAVPCLKVC